MLTQKIAQFSPQFYVHKRDLQLNQDSSGRLNTMYIYQFLCMFYSQKYFQKVIHCDLFVIAIMFTEVQGAAAKLHPYKMTKIVVNHNFIQ